MENRSPAPLRPLTILSLGLALLMVMTMLATSPIAAAAGPLPPQQPADSPALACQPTWYDCRSGGTPCVAIPFCSYTAHVVNNAQCGGVCGPMYTCYRCDPNAPPPPPPGPTATPGGGTTGGGTTGGSTGGGTGGCGNNVCDPTDLNDGCGWECSAPPPPPPHANDDTVTMYANSSVIIDFGANDTAPNGGVINPTKYTWTILTKPKNIKGAFKTSGYAEGTALYTPPTGFTGAQIITYNLRRDSNGANDNATITITILPPVADVAITKTPSTTSVGTGGTFTYTLTVTNNGPSTAENVVVNDSLPANLSLVSANPVPTTQNGQDLTWNLGTLPTGDTLISITVLAISPGVASNSALVTTTTADPDNSNNTATAPDVAISTPAGLSIVKSSSALVVLTGGTFTYTLSVTNSGPADADSVAVTDSLPANVTFVSSSPAPTTQAGQDLTWDLGTLAAGSTAITVTVQGSAPGTASNTGVVSSTTPDNDTSDNTSTADVTITDPAAVSIQKTTAATSVTLGSAFDYTLTVSNAGPGSALNTVVSDTLPIELTFVSANPTPTTQNGQALSWDLGSLPPGDTIITLSVKAVIPGTASNGVTVAAGNDPDTADNDDTAPDVQIAFPPGVGIYKTTQTTSALTGETFNYSLVITNGGPGEAENVVVTDTLPPQLTFVSSDPPPSSRNGPNLTWGLGTLADQDSAIISLVVKATAPGTAINVGIVSTTTPDSDPNDNSSTAPPVTISYPQGISISKTVDTSQANVGDTFTYTLDVNNGGPGSADNVEVSDSLPSELSFVSADPAPTSQTGQTLKWQLGTVPPGTTRITLTVKARHNGLIINEGSVTTSSPDPNPDDNTDSAPPVIVVGGSNGGGGGSPGPAPLILGDPVITKLGSPDHATIGETVTWTITVSNPADTPTDPVAFIDSLPATFDVVNVIIDPGAGGAGSGTYTTMGHDIAFDLGVLAPQATIRIQIITTVNGSGEPGQVCNTLHRPNGEPLPASGCVTLTPNALPTTGFGPLIWPWGAIGATLLAAIGGLALLFRRPR